MISFIIPTLNEERVIEKILKNLSEYSGSKEIIVSDGGSKDKTQAMARKYTDKVVVYAGTARQTIGDGKNLGAAEARGKYLVFLDADMYIPDINIFFKKALGIFENDKKLVGMTAYLKVIPEIANLPDKFWFFLFNNLFYLMNNIFHSGVAYGEFQMVRTDIFKKINGYDETLAVAEDNEFFKRLSKQGRTTIDPELVVFHTSRRAHKIGWPRLLASWWINQLSVTFRNKSWHSEWKEIR